MEKFHIAGLKEAYKMIDHLAAKDQQRIILSVLRNAANKNIKSKLEGANRYGKSKSRKKKPFITINDRKNPLGIMSGVSGDYFHYRFLEYGTNPRYTKSYKTGKRYILGQKYKTITRKRSVYRGFVGARPFLRNVIPENIPNVINYFINNFGAAVKKRLDMMARKKK